VIQLTAIVAGRSFPMLTPEPIAEAAKSCADRFGARFEGFAPIPVEIVARSKWAEFKAGDVSGLNWKPGWAGRMTSKRFGRVLTD